MPERKNILFLCHDATIYGAQKSLELMVNHLPHDRYRIFVSFEREGELAQQFRERDDITVLTSKRMHMIRHKPRYGMARVGDWVGMALSGSRATHLARLCRQHKIDLVHSNTMVSMTGAMAAKMLGIPHVWQIREWFGEPNHRMQLILGETMTKRVVHQFSDKVLCVSNLVREQFEPYMSKAPERYEVLYNALDVSTLPDLNKFHPQKRDDTINLLYLGRISDGKRFQDLVDALIILKSTKTEASLNPFPFRLNVYGTFTSEQFEQRIRQEITKAGLDSVIVFNGYTSNITECFAGTDFLIHPSTNESFGRTVIEAMGHGVPVVAAQSGGPTEIIDERKTGYFYPPYQPKALAEILMHLGKNPIDNPNRSEECQQSVKKRFSVEVQIDKLISIYDSFLAN